MKSRSERAAPAAARWGEPLTRALPAYFERQRWYGDKGRRLRAVAIEDWAELDAGGEGARAEDQRLLLVLVAAAFAAGAPARYQLPLRLAAAGPEPAEGAFPGAAVASFAAGGRDWRLDSGAESEAMRRALLHAAARERRLAGDKGEFVFAPGERYGHWLWELASSPGRSRPAGAEQSNTSLVFADRAGNDRLVLKLFRRLAAGPQPEIELTEYLTERAGFDAIPLLAGSIRYEAAGGSSETATALGVWQQYVANQGDGWSHMLARLTAPSAAAGAAGEELVTALGRLAERTAHLHRALAAATLPEMAPEAITAADASAWAEQLRAAAKRRSGELAAAESSELPPEARAAAERRLTEMARDLRGHARLRGLPGTAKLRIHGDFHLGQTLVTPGGDWVLFDFEGEPARPLAERRSKQPVLRDVAGILRSLDYLAAAARRNRARRGAAVGEAEAARLEAWRLRARAAFWREYQRALGGRNSTSPAAPRAASRSREAPPWPLLPASPAARERALGFFEADKAIYEVGYELRHRPGWLPIPLEALRRWDDAQ